MSLSYKEPGVAWVTTAADNCHLGTWVVELQAGGECAALSAPAADVVHVSVTVLRKPCKLVGTALFCLTRGGSCKKCSAPLWTCTSSTSTRKTRETVALEAPEGYGVTCPKPAACTCSSAFAEQSWPVPVCSGQGYGILAATDAVGDTDALMHRWDAYCDAATILLRSKTPPPDVMLAVVLQRGAGHYEPEDIDDRGPAEITFCNSQDCDGQATSVALFANMMLRHGPSMRVRHHRLLTHLIKRYREAAVVTGIARSPRNGPRGSTFGHAWAALIAKDAPKMQPLRGCLLLEATAPISPLQGLHPGVMPCDDTTAAEKLARAMEPGAKQIVVGVRELLDWYYGKLWSVYGGDWAVDMQGQTWTTAVAGGAGSDCCCCDAARHPLRQALYPRLTRGARQTMLHGHTMPRVTPPKHDTWALASTFDVDEDTQIHDLMSTHKYLYYKLK